MKNKKITRILIPVLAISGCIFLITFAISESPTSINTLKTVEQQSSSETEKLIPKNMIRIPSISLDSKDEAESQLKEAGIKVKYVEGNFIDEVSDSTPFIPKGTVDYDPYQDSVTTYYSFEGWNDSGDYIDKNKTLIVKVADQDYNYKGTKASTNSEENSDTTTSTFQPTTIYDEGGIKLEQTNWNSFKVTNNSNQTIYTQHIDLDIDGQEVNPWSLGLLWKEVAVGRSITGSIKDYDKSGLLKKGKTLHAIIEFDDNNWNTLGTAEFNLILENTIE